MALHYMQYKYNIGFMEGLI